MPSVPFCASEAPTLPAGLPTVWAASEGRSPAHSGHNLPQRARREPCCGCGCTDWLEGHFALGRLWCLTCWQGSQRPAVAMPPTAEGRAQLDLWIAGQPSRGARP